MALHVSVGLPNCREGRLHPVESVTVDWILGVARQAEELGFHGVWANEFAVTEPGVASQFTRPGRYFDAIAILSAVATATASIRLTTATLILPHHEPVLLAKQAATLDWISGGRLTLGFGLGGSVEEYRRLYGAGERVNRGAMMDEYLPALRALWTDRHATYSGESVRFESAEMFPKPVQDPLPIWLAGDADAVFRRIARYGQGWIDSHSGREEMQAKIATIRGYLEAEGRDPDSLEVGRQVYVAVASTDEGAERVRRDALAADRIEGTALPVAKGERVVVGAFASVAERLREFASAGATEIAVIFYARDPQEHADQVRAFHDDVLPQLA